MAIQRRIGPALLPVGLSRLSTLCAATLLLATVGCQSTSKVPADVAEAYRIAERYQQLEDYGLAIESYTAVLTKHEDIAPARIARAQCYVELTKSTPDPNLDADRLQRALADLDHAARKSEGGTRAQALVLQGRLLDQLERPAEALQVFKAMVNEPSLNQEELAQAHLRIGEQLLANCTRNRAADQRLPPGDVELIDQCTQARYHYKTCLDIFPESRQALYGIGLCFLLGDRAAKAEQSLQRVITLTQRDLKTTRQELDRLAAAAKADSGETTDEAKVERAEREAQRVALVDSLNLQRDRSMRATFFHGVARERRLGPNARSDQQYTESLMLDDARKFSLVYSRILERLPIARYNATERRRIIMDFIRYEGSDQSIWLRAHHYFGGIENPTSEDILGRAVAAARLNRLDAALDHLDRLAEQDEVPIPMAEAIPLALTAGTPMDDLSRSHILLARSRAYRRVFPTGDYPQRSSVWNEFRKTINAFDSAIQEQGAAAPAAQTLHLAQLCGSFSEELLDNLELENRETLLDEASVLTDRQRQLLAMTDQPRFEPIYRKGTIQAFVSGAETVDHTFAEEAIEAGGAHFTPAFLVLIGAYERQPDATRERLEKLILKYTGEDARIQDEKELIRERETARNVAADAAREKAKLEEQARAEEIARKKRFRDCPVCNFKAQKSALVCLGCGSKLDPVKD